MKLQAKLAILIATFSFLSGCATTSSTPDIQNSNTTLGPTVQEKNQAKLQSAVYQ